MQNSDFKKAYKNIKRWDFNLYKTNDPQELFLLTNKMIKAEVKQLVDSGIMLSDVFYYYLVDCVVFFYQNKATSFGNELISFSELVGNIDALHNRDFNDFKNLTGSELLELVFGLTYTYDENAESGGSVFSEKESNITGVEESGELDDPKLIFKFDSFFGDAKNPLTNTTSRDKALRLLVIFFNFSCFLEALIESIKDSTDLYLSDVYQEVFVKSSGLTNVDVMKTASGKQQYIQAVYPKKPIWLMLKDVLLVDGRYSSTDDNLFIKDLYLAKGFVERQNMRGLSTNFAETQIYLPAKPEPIQVAMRGLGDLGAAKAKTQGKAPKKSSELKSMQQRVKNNQLDLVKKQKDFRKKQNILIITTASLIGVGIISLAVGYKLYKKDKKKRIKKI